jgi:hypothetical protein
MICRSGCRSNVPGQDKSERGQAGLRNEETGVVVDPAMMSAGRCGDLTAGLNCGGERIRVLDMKSSPQDSIPPRSPGGWSTLTTWTDELNLDGHCITFVRGIDEREALLRLGAPGEAIGLMTFKEAGDRVLGLSADASTFSATASRVGEWIVLVEQNGNEGVQPDTAEVLSAGTDMVSVYCSVNADGSFVYARDGVLLAGYDTDDGPDPMSMDGEEPEALAPYIERIGLDRFEDDGEDDDLECARPSLELAHLIAQVQPVRSDFDGELLGAYWS